MATKRFRDSNFRMACLDALFSMGKLKSGLENVLKIGHPHDYSEDINKKRLAAFKKIDLDQQHLDLITDFGPDGGDDIYSYLIPNWTGAQRDVYISSFADLKLLTNLNSLSVYAVAHPGSLDLRCLKSLRKLQHVETDDIFLDQSYDVDQEIAELEKRGVTVDID